MLCERADIPDCDECQAFQENPAEFAEKEICPDCAWSRDPEEPIIFKLLAYLDLLDAGCPVSRHELTDEEWRLVGIVKSERERFAVDKAKEEAAKNAGASHG
ncbi:MAG: hypothetical protein QME66_04700 [Candidatus Eisenbacteria bacterium]|nr:hypothetical protein [Candidatus Eisenbacteria bacterium]